MDVRVAGIFMTGVREYDDGAVKLPLPAAQQLQQTKKVEKLLVFLNETDDTDAVHASLQRTFDRSGFALEMRDWSQLATFYHQVVLLYNGIFGFLGILVFGIVIFSVANTMAMSIFERTRAIGTLMALATPRVPLCCVFLIHAF